jgi:uncharacterized protein YndB with AHSA1/START domain
MAEINHRVGLKASAEEIYEALTTNSGLATWWTNDVSGAGSVGSIIEFRFNGGGPDCVVTELIPNKIVRFKHSGSMHESWMGTEILFQLQVEGEHTFVRFTHLNCNESSDFMAHCSNKWAVFLISFKDAVEANQGKSFQNDIQIDHS